MIYKIPHTKPTTCIWLVDCGEHVNKNAANDQCQAIEMLSLSSSACNLPLIQSGAQLHSRCPGRIITIIAHNTNYELIKDYNYVLDLLTQ